MQVRLRPKRVDWWWKEKLNWTVWAWREQSASICTCCFPSHVGDAYLISSHLTSSGPQPTVSKGTHVIIPLVKDLERDRWEAAVVKQDDNRTKLSVNSPPTAVIGRYQLTVETDCASGRAVSTHDPANDIYMLFNPWCEGTPCNKIFHIKIFGENTQCSVKWVYSSLWSLIVPHFGKFVVCFLAAS